MLDIRNNLAQSTRQWRQIGVLLKGMAVGNILCVSYRSDNKNMRLVGYGVENV